MRTHLLSRLVAILAGLTLAGACSDSTDNSSIDLLPGAVDGFLTLSPTSATIVPGQTVLLHAGIHDRLGMPLPQVTVRWSSHNEAVASVSGAGEVHGKAEGHAVIVATAAGKSQTATIHVLRRGPDIGPRPSMDPAPLAQ
jgi:hypothetical protein